MRDYEMVVLVHPDLEIDLDKALKKIEGLVAAQSGKITKTDNWGKRKLAYRIKQQDYAVYVYYELQLPPAAVTKLDSTLNITGEVLRHLLTHPVPEVEEKEAGDAKDSKDGANEDSKTAKSEATTQPKADAADEASAMDIAKTKTTARNATPTSTEDKE